MRTLLDSVMWLAIHDPSLVEYDVARILSFDLAAAPCSFSHLSKAPEYSLRTQ